MKILKPTSVLIFCVLDHITLPELCELFDSTRVSDWEAAFDP